MHCRRGLVDPASQLIAEKADQAADKGQVAVVAGYPAHLRQHLSGQGKRIVAGDGGFPAWGLEPGFPAPGLQLPQG